MGKAARWLKGLLGMKKEKEREKATGRYHVDNSNAVNSDKKRWSFGVKSGRDNSVSPRIPANIPVNDSSWLRSYLAESENEQSKHAIAVAAATAAAADAAVAAAQAAVAVVRLTSNSRGTIVGGGRERWAAVKIQTFFRGYLVSQFSSFFPPLINATWNLNLNSSFSHLGIARFSWLAYFIDVLYIRFGFYGFTFLGSYFFACCLKL